MLLRLFSTRSRNLCGLALHHVKRPLQEQKVQDCHSHYFLGRSRNFLPQIANFSVSTATNGIFDFWVKKDDPGDDITEKVFTFDDSGSTGMNLDVGDTAMSLDSSRTFESHSPDITQDVQPQSVAGESSPLVDQSADFIGTLDNLPDTVSSFADYGLGGGILPHRLFQDILEYLTNSMGLEWIPAIAVLTILVRLLTVPGNIIIRQHSAKSHNLFPQTLEKMEAVQKAAAEQNQFKMRKAQMEYMEFMRSNGTSPLRPLLINLPNMVIFASMFMGIRQMCVAKFPTLLDGGALWFTNLTIPDPYMILPLVSCVSMSMIIRSGAADAEMGAAASMDGFRKILMWLPIVSLPFLIFQPAAMFSFWVVSNCFTVAMMLILRNKGVQRALKIPERVKHEKHVAKKMENAMNPVEIFRKAKEAGKQRKELLEKVQKYQNEIKKMQELAKKDKK